MGRRAALVAGGGSGVADADADAGTSSLDEQAASNSAMAGSTSQNNLQRFDLKERLKFQILNRQP